MSIFSRIKDAIFGSAAPAAASPTAPARPATPSMGTNAGARTAGIPASPADAAWERKPEVDLEAVLVGLEQKSGQKLNWRTSIVDLMKMLGIDSGIANRKELARELGYAGDLNQSAEMNVWLHKRVMSELERNGGKVPAALTN